MTRRSAVSVTADSKRVTATARATKAQPKPRLSIIDACLDPEIFGGWFKDTKTWAAWFAFLKVVFGLPLDDAELATFRECTGRTAL